MSVQNRATIRRLYREILGEGNLAVADELFSPDFVDHMSIMDTPDRAGLLKAMMAARKAFPDLSYQVITEISDGHWIAIAVTVDGGAHQGTFMGLPPTGKPVTWTETHLWRVVDAKIVEHYGNVGVFEIHKMIGSHNIESKLR